MNTRELVLDMLLTLDREGDYSHRLVRSVLDKYDYLEARDKAFIKRLAEGTLERQLELDYYLDCYSSLPVRKMKPLIRCLLRMSVYQLLYMDSVPDSAVCNEACRLAAKRGFGTLKGFVNGVLRKISRQKDALPMPDKGEKPVSFLSVQYSMPEWLVEMWMDEYGTDMTETLLQGLLAVHPVSLRFSTLISDEEREAICRELCETGMEMKQSAYLPCVYLTKGYTENPASLPAFVRGKCIVQDVSSALAVEAAGVKEGDFVVDVCAAPGGKSILAAEKAGSGRVLARDISEEKRGITEENISRMRAGNIEVQVFDGTRTDEALLGKADVVLLDVPCSGLGVMGKKRDIKYRVTKESLGEIEKLQRRIVAASAGYVRKGGTLLYSTCTIRREENEDMVRFIARELGLEPVPLAGVLPEAVLAEKKHLEGKMREAGKEPGAGLTEEEADACIQLLPGYMKADGFFIARFRRR
ncbi:MAG TPA: 16S rRNA (cytosine(967)-C(5))-methyltransferase [Lachnospiraceae bacterium]|nr:16S rRNA (cytosine(967)-C(5))-methyltransferase [Lachnospiraceae bacterium]